ncbi:MAG TPA: hypothetical protein VE999_09880 [Gemmataceae bacterium]|nr:hypothetical protein [Gemmataceae bacterium]
MILCFPDLDTLFLALTSRAVPPDVAQKSAIAGFGEEEEVWVETPAKLPAAAQRELKHLGVQVCKSSNAALSTDVSCWLELLPLARDDVLLDVLDKTPVLFDVSSGEELSRLILEMLRLGNDRQSYRWLEEKSNGDNCRALLRVVGPPYYSLLGALDQLGGPGIAPHAFVERAPGVWVEVGYRHPLADSIKPPKGKILLLRPPRHWLMVPDAPFRDIYEIVEFQIPDRPVRWKDSSLPHRLTVTPRLRPAGPTDGAELWVLRGEAIDELNRFVQNAEDQLLGRLAFAVGEKNGQTIVVLRVRQSKLPPPVLVLPAEAYKSHLKLPNLFLPAGHTLHPPLRRDVVRKLLAEDPSQITWLAPVANEENEPSGSFSPEVLPEDVFRPLTDWVDYVLDRDREQLQAWVQAMRFEFESFVCDEEQPSKPKKPPASEKTRGPKAAPTRPKAEGTTGEAIPFETMAETAMEETMLEAFAAVEKVEPSEIEKELRAVEDEFLALPGGLDDESRRTLWPRLADLNARLSKWEDAGICWLNGLWDAGDDAGKWTAAWFRTEAVGAAHRHASHAGSVQPWIAGAASVQGLHRDVTGDDLDDLLSLPELETADLRALAAYLTWSARRDPRPPALVERLPALQRFLEKHEKLLPVRACWLAWYHLVQLTDGDVLALARARDRMLERLFHNGLRPEQDLPSFLRYAGHPSSMRFRGMGQWLNNLCDKALRWLSKQKMHITASGKNLTTQAYAELVFAFGLARLGETDACRQRLKHARETLEGEKKIAHDYLCRAFTLRIEQALAGQPPRGELFSVDELERVEKAEKKRREEAEKRQRERTANKGGEADLGPGYVIDRMRNISRILEPHQRVVPYRSNLHHQEEHEKELAALPDVMDKKDLEARVYRLLQHVPKGDNRLKVLVRVVQAGLEQAPRAGEKFACDMLSRAVKVYDADVEEPLDLEALRNRASLLQKALFVAGHFDRVEHVHALTARFQAMLQSQFRKMLESAADSLTLETVDDLVGHCLYGLRKLGLRSEIERLLTQVTDSILGGRSLATVAANANNWSLVRALLPVAGGRYYFGQDAEAEMIFQAARLMLFKNELDFKQQTHLACTYASALGQAPMPIAQERLMEIFERLDNIYDGFSTIRYFSQYQFRLIESVVLAVISDDFTQGTQTRRWLDEDEYLIRQRIHGDVRTLTGQV